MGFILPVENMNFPPWLKYLMVWRSTILMLVGTWVVCNCTDCQMCWFGD